ncbi:ABC-F family ATP-binding cassette domain-containing protein [Glacieibacterium frigidum]|uniref:ATP-binding cassette domain-containing protein n=1 Tax=Glacieibacterium frigidum TaxID=2593303 RepID=A0A552UH22_9SPHN|nr:ATP-binding cassette domain-containing protein [Glacieibacterium frigidum]TRW17491.1 ATP-binding cassette domain-containing protein [Glacieibacterium frigidum]
MAAPLLSLENIGLNQGTKWLFRGLGLFVGERDRLALVGRNGAGKTTLLRLLAGTLEPDEGRRVQRPGAKIVLLEQDPSVAGFATLRDFAMAEPDAPEFYEVDAIADQLGLDLDRDAATASGGERRRAAICRALAQAPDLLLLDEPTNHLDITAIEWLETHLQRFKGAFIAISHDRMFLSRLTKACAWLDRGTMRRAEIGFGGFEAWTDAVTAEEERNAEKLDTKLKQELHWLARGVTARRKRNMGRLGKLDELRATRKAMTGPQGVAKLQVTAEETKTKIVIDAEHVNKSFGDRAVIKDLTLRVQRGDRIGVIGPNGAGKTTLLKLLTGELAPDSGRIRRAKTLQGVLIDQQRALLSPGKTVRDVLADGGDWVEVGGERKHVVGYLKDFLFTADVLDAKVETFSGGERSRLLLAREFARPSNLLILDEPTNDLDLETLDLLQEVIDDYAGTVLLVSHDRDFLDRTVTMVVGLDGSGTADVVVGGYADWQAKRKADAAPPPPRAAAAPVAVKRTVKLTYIEQRELDGAPAKIEALGKAIKAAELAMADPALYARDPKKFDALNAEAEAKRREVAVVEERWLILSEKAEGLAA